jgi:hypothetical protein
MVETLCDSGAVKLKAGANYSIGISGAQFTQLINQAESTINMITRVNWTDNYAALNVDVAKVLEDAASSHAAIGIINHDMSGYTSRAEAQTMLDVNYSRFSDAIRWLKEKFTTDWIEDQ